MFARSDTKIDKLTVTLPKIRGSMAWELKDEDRSENYRRYLVDNDINNIVSTVGLGIGSPIPFLSHGELNEMIAANLVSPFLILKHSALSLKQLGGGRIVLFGSIVSIQPEQGASGYSATKMGLRGLVESARRELKNGFKSVSVHCVYSGNVKKVEMGSLVDAVCYLLRLPYGVNADVVLD